MNYGHPKMLWVMLAALPLLGLFLWATWRKRQALVRQFVQHKALLQQTLGISTARQKLRRVLLFFAVAFLLLAIARPQWGFTWEEAVQRGRDIIVAIDTSRSMLAEDIQPNRLTRAKLAALDLLQLGKFDRFGLVAFAGTAFLQCPLTFDDEAFRQNVELLKPGIIPQGGTAIGEAIDAAREAFAQDADENHRILILFTDGEDHEASVMGAVSQAADAGIKIFTVGVGTAAGELLRVRDEQGRMQFVKDDAGNVVKSRLNEELLKEIAANTGGSYVQLQGGNTMELLYQSKLAPLPTSERTTKLMKQFKEQFYWPLAAAILLLMIEVFVPEQKRAARAKAAAPGTVPAAVTMLLLLLALPSSQGNPAKAQRYYRNGDYQASLSQYQELLGRAPDDPRLQYNAGAAAYQAGQYDQAMKSFQAAAGSRDLDLQQQSFYNMGNAEFRLGQGAANPQERIALWEKAVQHYEAALNLNSSDKDAAFNRDLVEKKLEELKKQQQQQQQQQNQNKDNKEENREDKDDQSQDRKQKNNQDQQQQDEKSKQDKQEQQNNQQEQQSEEQEKQQQQQQQQQNQQKQDEQQKNESQASKQGDQKETDQQQPQPEDGGEVAQLGKMTPAQARQLLDAQRGEEKALIFIPQERKSDPRNRTFKDW
mgnify:CR=1 FL=1